MKKEMCFLNNRLTKLQNEEKFYGNIVKKFLIWFSPHIFFPFLFLSFFFAATTFTAALKNGKKKGLKFVGCGFTRRVGVEVGKRFGHNRCQWTRRVSLMRHWTWIFLLLLPLLLLPFTSSLTGFKSICQLGR